MGGGGGSGLATLGGRNMMERFRGYILPPSFQSNIPVAMTIWILLRAVVYFFSHPPPFFKFFLLSSVVEED